MVISVEMSRAMNRLVSSLANRVNEKTDKAEFSKALQSSDNSFVLKPLSISCLGSIGKNTYPGKYGLLNIDLEEELDFKYSQAKFQPTELEINWAVPSCMGPHLFGSPFDDHAQEYIRTYPQEYAELMEKRAERCKAVSDFFYNGFDDEGKPLYLCFS